ncbi:amino acid adenylation domain-containing protein [Streptomyces sp. BBFR2]|uniref:amino acid adenylation domain-containing protein n=1 Tax=Streptomyces sp. BBFR2 TaxID=3372854 RepID=UPI0037DA686F
MTTLHQLFAETAARHPGRTAVSDGTRALTYAELDRAANRLAHTLVRSGVRPGQLVALCAERDTDLVVGVLGILKAGAGYLPLDPRYPLARLRDTVADAGARLLVGTPVAGLDLETIDPAGPHAADGPKTAPDTGAGPDDTAYVIYTSGSTGRPKGVVVSHHNVVRLFTATRPEFGFGPDDVWTMFHSIAFDFSVWELWGALLHGGQVVVVPYDVSRDPEAFLRLLVDRGVTMLSQTPSAFRQLSRTAEDAGFPDTSLRAVVFGGEKLELATLRPWIGHYGDRAPELVNMYGITETTVHVTLRRVRRADLDDRRSPIGRPLADLTLHVLDEEMRPVPAGRTGELYVGGAGVTQGYLNRPELTRERFLPDPFADDGTLLYRTGDLAEHDGAGEVYFHGRSDGQVQLRGFRIELGEIEAALLREPAVRESVVLVREDRPGEQRLVAYWVGDDSAGTAAALRTALTAALPAHMVPGDFVPLPALPMTVNGKLDRDALPAPAGPARAADGERAAPADHVEKVLAEIWAEQLGVADIGRQENFFALGGDSIRAIPLVARAREAGLPLTVVALYGNPTVAQLAAWCRTRTEEAGDGPGAGGSGEEFPAPEGVEAVYPASALQQGIIFHTKVSGDPTLYHDLESVRVTGPLDLPALDSALAALVARHEILRTSFDLGTHRQVVQQVHQEAELTATLVPAPAGCDPDEAVRSWWQGQVRNGFDVTRAPLVRCHVIQHAEEDFHLAVSAHHSVLDGWSFAQLMTDLLTGYDRELSGLPALPPGEHTFRYRDFVALERAEADSDRAREFFAAQLEGATPTRLPAPEPDGPDPAAGPGPETRVLIPGPLVEQVESLAARLGTPAKSVYLTAHLAALGHLTGDKDLVTGMVVNGRPEVAGAETALGLFLNTVPVRLDLAGRPWPELIRAVFAAEQEMLAHRRFPLARIQREVGAAPFTALFNFTSFTVADTLAGLDHLRTGPWWLSDRNSFPVSVEIGRLTGSDQWKADVTVDPARVSPEAGRQLAEAVLEQLQAIVHS